MMENPKNQNQVKPEETKVNKKTVIKRADKQQEEKKPKRTWWVQIRLIPIWLRVILVVVLFAGVAILGLQLGYSYIGDGDIKDVLKKETWTHILDIKDGKE